MPTNTIKNLRTVDLRSVGMKASSVNAFTYPNGTVRAAKGARADEAHAT